jgi:AcrR family transcriptional regulator
MMTDMKSGAPTRPYRMTRRAALAQRTHDAVLDAAVAAIPGRPWAELTVEEIAVRAGVSARTVLRRFGSKDGLARAAAERAREEVRAGRPAGAPGDLHATIAELGEHYERWADVALWLLDEGRRAPVLAEAARDGERLHEDWVRRAFAPQLAALPAGPARRRALAALAAATDVHVWDLLRRRSGLSRRDAEAAVRDLCSGALEA